MAPFRPPHQAITSPGLAMILTFFTALPLHRADLAMCLCAFALLLKNDGHSLTGTTNIHRNNKTYRVTVVRLPFSDIAQAQNSTAAIHMSKCRHMSSSAASDCSMDSIRVEIAHVWNTPGMVLFLRECMVIKSSQVGHHYISAAKCVQA